MHNVYEYTMINLCISQKSYTLYEFLELYQEFLSLQENTNYEWYFHKQMNHTFIESNESYISSLVAITFSG